MYVANSLALTFMVDADGAELGLDGLGHLAVARVALRVHHQRSE